MIPYLPQETDPSNVPKFYRQIQENLVIRSMHHEAWHTHKRDSSVCWICDLIELSSICITEMERFISKSLLDIDEQFHDSEVISEEEVIGDHEDPRGDSEAQSENIPGDI